MIDGIHQRMPLSANLCAARLGLILVLALSAGMLHSAPLQRSLFNKQAPAFTRIDLSGERVSLHAYRGKLVLLNFWATWCAPCQVELPRFAAWQRKFGASGLQVIAVSMDDDQAPVRAVVRRLDPNFPVMMGDEKLGKRYGGILGLPITFLIGRDGKVIARFEGETDLGTMENQLKEILAKR